MKEKKRYNLKDVAALAGVSLGSASKVINNQYVKPELRIRVESAMRELDYVPNTIARSLKANNSKTIGVIVPDLSSPINGKVLRGIEDIGNQAGYSILIYDANMSDASVEKALVLFQEKMVSGIIYSSASISDQMGERIRKMRIPAVLLMTGEGLTGFSTVTLDNRAAAYDMTNYLISCGHRRILLLAGELDDVNAGIPRVEGFRQALHEHGIPVDEELIIHGDYHLERGYRDMKAVLEQGLNFTAVFAVADEISIGAMKALYEKNLRIPEDISMAGFDGINVSNFVLPPLTTIEQPFYQFGAEGMKILIDCVERDKKNVHVKLPWEMRRTASVRPRNEMDQATG